MRASAFAMASMDHVGMGPTAHLTDSQAPGTPASRARAAWAWVTLLLGSCFGIDLWTGTELSVFLIYVLPVALATRHLGRSSGLWVALMASALWVLADQWGGHRYSQPWILWVNAANRLFTFLMAVVVVQHLWRDRDRAVQRWRRLTHDVADCTQCHDWRGADGAWRSPAQHLQELGGVALHPKVCPACARRQYARAAYRDGGAASATTA